MKNNLNKYIGLKISQSDYDSLIKISSALSEKSGYSIRLADVIRKAIKDFIKENNNENNL